MAPLTFSQALVQAEAQARRTLAPELHERLSDAVVLVKDGRVFQATDGIWQVDSATSQGLTYAVNGTCTCDDVHFNKPPQGLCKHRISVYLARRVFQLMAPPAPVAPETHLNMPPERHLNPLPEAPASVNVRLQFAGREVQLTLRDVDEARLLARLAAVLERYPVPQPAPQAPTQPQGQGWCAKHQTAMKQTTKDGRSWWSHKTAEGWCKGR